MRLPLALFPLLFAASNLFGDEFLLGGRTITVPAPAGFVLVTDAMAQVKRLSDQMADPMNDTLAFYISAAAAPVALAGGMPSLDQYFILKVNKTLRNRTLGVSEFAELKTAIRTQNQKAFEEVKAKIPDFLGTVSKNITKEFNVDLAMEISQMVPLDPHFEDEGTLSYSMYIDLGVTAGGKKETAAIPATATFLNASGSLLFLYSYGRKGDLEWTRVGSASWAKSVLDGNIRPPTESPRHGIDWSQVGEKAMIGAVIGGVVSLISGLTARRRKQKAPQPPSPTPEGG